MAQVVFTFICALLFALILTPLLRNVAIGNGLLDRPDRERKFHAKPVPRLGGVAVMLAFALSLCTLSILAPQPLSAPSGPLSWQVLIGSIVVLTAGLLDDLVGLKPWHKLGAGAIAATLAWEAGIRFQNLAGISLPVWASFGITVFWILACTNAFNLIDGMDGLASGLGVIAAAALIAGGFLSRDPAMILVAAPLAGALLGFLRFNFTNASIFLGDCGSLCVGFLLSCLSIKWSQNVSDPLGSIGPLLILAVPLTDTTLCVLRRYLGIRPIFHADCNHIHHRLLRRGFKQVQAVSVLYAASAFCGLVALLLSANLGLARLLLLAAFSVLLVGAVRYFNYPELRFLARRLHPASIRTAIRTSLILSECEESVRSSTSPEECWRILSSASRALNLGPIVLRAGSRTFQESLEYPQDHYWSVHIPLAHSDFVRMFCPLNAVRDSSATSAFVELLRRALPAKTFSAPQLDRRTVGVAAGLRMRHEP